MDIYIYLYIQPLVVLCLSVEEMTPGSRVHILDGDVLFPIALITSGKGKILDFVSYPVRVEALSIYIYIYIYIYTQRLYIYIYIYI